MRLLLTFLFALGVLTGTGGRFVAPKAAPAPAAPPPATASAHPAATPQPNALVCPRCGPSARRVETAATPKIAAEAHPTPRPSGA
jgi:hypothetical protein